MVNPRDDDLGFGLQAGDLCRLVGDEHGRQGGVFGLLLERGLLVGDDDL
jgi:hypothetical protein